MVERDQKLHQLPKSTMYVALSLLKDGIQSQYMLDIKISIQLLHIPASHSFVSLGFPHSEVSAELIIMFWMWHRADLMTPGIIIHYANIACHCACWKVLSHYKCSQVTRDVYC